MYLKNTTKSAQHNQLKYCNKFNLGITRVTQPYSHVWNITSRAKKKADNSSGLVSKRAKRVQHVELEPEIFLSHLKRSFSNQSPQWDTCP